MRSTLQKASIWLRRKFPSKKPVIVRVVANQPGLHGIILWNEERALIRITRSTDQMMAETLLEEWAHLLREQCPIPCEEGGDHDALFWAILARITKEWRGE